MRLMRLVRGFIRNRARFRSANRVEGDLRSREAAGASLLRASLRKRACCWTPYARQFSLPGQMCRESAAPETTQANFQETSHA
jgi:hypothetical protein